MFSLKFPTDVAMPRFFLVCEPLYMPRANYPASVFASMRATRSLEPIEVVVLVEPDRTNLFFMCDYNELYQWLPENPG